MADLPPLNALRTFEVAARHLSFTRAAEELHITQAAVSQQMKGLEEALGVPLFRRLNRRLWLTDAGQEYACSVREALQIVRDATVRLRPEASHHDLTLSLPPSLAHKWLMPRLGRFIDRHPALTLRLHTTYEVMRLGIGPTAVHCAIRQGRGPYPGLFAELLLRENLTPVCAPGLAAQLATPEDLRRVPVIRDEGVSWADWLAAAGLPQRAIGAGPTFLDSSMAVQAAIDGRGVTLGRSVMIADDLAAGRLVEPFRHLGLQTPYLNAVWFLCPQGQEVTPAIQALLGWLKEEVSTAVTP
ncbi:transcriptional regulator GcvA [Novispirillum itersonii]|uniref:transcriptional regulator GcvA n=1 Tax=Novispirillum itersonii TaxID=189 RepID=UPI0003664DB3|nr:transcriptional regulator GcvA [Novispirillum itersonii]